MVAERRFGPIVALLFVGLAVLLVRLFQVQILEHETWGREAQSLVRSSKVVPYHRGAILDRNGRALVKDEDFYQIEFCYRDFRRGHPLGQIAHARSALEMRAVPLAEALANMEAWAAELVALSPRDIEDFRRGKGLRTASFNSPPVDPAAPDAPSDREARLARGSDLRYYIGELLHVTAGERLDLGKQEKGPTNDLSYAELVANKRKIAPAAVLDALRTELTLSRDHLAFMADMLKADLERSDGEPSASARNSADGKLGNHANLANLDASETGGSARAGLEPSSGAQRVRGVASRAAVSSTSGASTSGASPSAASARDARAPDPAALDWLVALLERNRRRVEDSVADELFFEAANFAPGRLDSAALSELIDIGWIGSMLRWDSARTLEWARSRRLEYERELEEDIVPRILLRVETEGDEHARSNRLLSELARLFVPIKEGRRRTEDDQRSWTELDELCVLSQLDEIFRARVSSAEYKPPRAVLPFQDPDVRAAWRESEDPWSVVGAVSELVSDVPDVSAAPAAPVAPVAPVASAEGGMAARLAASTADEFVPPKNGAEAATRWRKLSEAGFGPDDRFARAELVWLASNLERRFLSVCDRALRAREIAQDAARPLVFAEDRVSGAREQEKFIQRDRQNRPMLFPGTPGYELVHLFARYPERYRGFEVRETTRRIPLAFDADGRPFARLLVGSVRKPSLAQLFAQTGDLRRLSNLQSKILRSDEDEREMRDINARLYRRDEYTGGFGIEEYFDRELRGKYGYREIEGLEQRAEGSTAALYQPPVDGKDITLTLDYDLQTAAEDAIQRPHMPRDGLADALWVENPIGAIVLVTPDGEVLAAASSPTKHGLPRTPGRDAERTQVRERTLQRPTFNPPGSVFKPFVAAYALDRLHFDPHTHFLCGLLPDGKYGYHEMHCHGGHGSCDMRTALADSCNAYFAQLGERFKPEEMIEMAHMFGFGEPTGILRFGRDERGGILEHSTLRQESQLLTRLAHVPDRLRFANGLGWMEATPMQVARATAGVLTGRLPELRIDRAIGGVETPHASKDLGLSRETLDYIRKALLATINENGGTAFEKGLDRQSLGFGFACKTGSADTYQFKKSPELTAADRLAMEQGKMRKHTWIAGWFPVENPKAVLIVYLHDVSETASHTAVYVAAQFLRSPAVRKFLDGAEAGSAAETNGVPKPPSEESSTPTSGKDASR